MMLTWMGYALLGERRDRACRNLRRRRAPGKNPGAPGSLADGDRRLCGSSCVALVGGAVGRCQSVRRWVHGRHQHHRRRQDACRPGGR